MQIDRSQFPVVFLRETADVEPDVDKAFAALLDEGRRFVVISTQQRHDDTRDPPEAKKARALFFKQTKGRLRQLCAAAIVIEDKATPLPLRWAAQGFGRAFGIPFHVVQSEEQAVTLANEVLSGSGA